MLQVPPHAFERLASKTDCSSSLVARMVAEIETAYREHHRADCIQLAYEKGSREYIHAEAEMDRLYKYIDSMAEVMARTPPETFPDALHLLAVASSLAADVYGGDEALREKSSDLLEGVLGNVLHYLMGLLPAEEGDRVRDAFGSYMGRSEEGHRELNRISQEVKETAQAAGLSRH